MTPNSASALVLPDECKSALVRVGGLTNEREAGAALETAMITQIASLRQAAWAPGYCRAVADNFSSKEVSAREGVRFTMQALKSTAVDFEAFRVTAFHSSGVAPKRYFGLLDGKGLAATYEVKLREVSGRVAPMLNAYAAQRQLGVTVTPKEIVVTHLAEGGAILLSSDFYLVDNIHPVSGIGLDDYRNGLKQYSDLVAEIDKNFNTRLGHIANNPERPGADSILGAGPVRRLERYLGIVSMTFEESVLATAVMYLWEKVITDEKRRADHRASLGSLPLDEQFVHASLVYNSGILFSDERAKQIMAFDTAAYLVDVSEKSASKRPKLAVMTSDDAHALLSRGDALPQQPTSWNAVYHILQRYGAWVAITKFTDYFTQYGAVAASP